MVVVGVWGGSLSRVLWEVWSTWRSAWICSPALLTEVFCLVTFSSMSDKI